MAKINKERLLQDLETKTVKEIAAEYGVKEVSIYKAASSYKISVKKIPLYQQESYLRTIDLSQTDIYQMGKQFCVDPDTIKCWFKRYQLPWKWEPWRNREWIEEKLKECEGSASLIARKYGFNSYTINQQCIKFGYRGQERKEKFSKQSCTYFSSIDTEDKAYFLGFLMADGYMSRDLGHCSLGITASDQEVLIKLKQVLNLNSQICIQSASEHRRAVATLYISSVQICKDLVYHGIVPRKTGKECLPDTVPRHLIRHFIRGFIDGDGYISPNKQACLYIVGMSLNIMNSINDYFVETLQDFPGGRIGTRIDHRTGHKKYFFRTFAQNTVNICNHIYKDAHIYLSRKYEAYMTFMSLRKESKKKK